MCTFICQKKRFSQTLFKQYGLKAQYTNNQCLVFPNIQTCSMSDMLHLMSKKSAATRENQIFAYVKTKMQISFAVTAKLISAFVFATRIVQFLYFINPKFQASSRSSVGAQASLCQTWSETLKTSFLASLLK